MFNKRKKSDSDVGTENEAAPHTVAAAVPESTPKVAPSADGRKAELTEPLGRALEVVFQADGTTHVKDDGRQVSGMVQPWLDLAARQLEDKGVDLSLVRFTRADGRKVKAVKVDGVLGWEIVG